MDIGSGGRELKAQVRRLVEGFDKAAALEALCRLPARRVVNPLFGLLCAADSTLAMRAATALGAVTARLAEVEMESARVVIRRMMWNLNEESGGIGWGCPEAMGEALARNGGLADEFASILISYLDSGGNFLEHPGLQQGVLWGIGRMGQRRPDLAAPAMVLALAMVDSDDPQVCGMAVWCLGCLGAGQAPDRLAALSTDQRPARWFYSWQVQNTTVGHLATQALAIIKQRTPPQTRFNF